MKSSRTQQRSPRRTVAAAVGCLAVLIAASAEAQTPEGSSPSPVAPALAPSPQKREPTAGDLATARTALREGLVLREKGDLQGALARLGSAFDLVPTPVTGFELGKTQMMLGHILQAHELFKKVVRMPPSMEESARSQTSRDEAARLAKELEPRIPTLRLKLTLPNGATATVRVDDEVIPLTGAETMRAVDPGPHEIVAKAGDGPEEKEHVEVAESETKDVALAPQWVAPKNPTPGKGSEVIYVRTTNPLAFVGFGVATAALIVTTISAFVFVDARDLAKDKCGSHYCPPASGRGGGLLPQSAVVDTGFEGENTRYQISGVVTVAAAFTTVVFVGVGIVGASRPIRERVIQPSVGLGHFGLSGAF